MILSTWSLSEDVTDNETNTTRERSNRRFEMLTIQQTTSIQRSVMSCDCRSK